MQSADSQTSEDDEQEAGSAVQQRRFGVDDVQCGQPVDSVQLAKFRAACQNRKVAQKIRESEARARALAVGSATEELKREQRKRRKAYQRAKQCEDELIDAQRLTKQLQYTNSKLQQQLASTQAAAKIAAERSNSSLRNLRETLCTLETDTSNKFAQGQRQVQNLISATKQIQSYVTNPSNNNSISSPTQHLQHPLTSTTCSTSSRVSNSQATQAISTIYQALATLGELLVPTANVLWDSDATSTPPTPDTAHATPAAVQSAAPACVNTPSSRDAGCLAAQLTVLQARLEDVTAERALLQQHCNSLQRQCHELQQQLKRQAGSCAELSHDSQVECVQQLAEVTSLQAEKLQAQREAQALQQSLASAQSALQLLREQHGHQTSRLAAANAEVLQLRQQLSKLEAEFQQQQQDAASALCIVSGREAHNADISMLAGRDTPRSNLLSCLARPGSAAAAPAAGQPGSPDSTRFQAVHNRQQQIGVGQLGVCWSGAQLQDPDPHRCSFASSAAAAAAAAAGIAAPQQASEAAEHWDCQQQYAAGRERPVMYTTTTLRPISAAVEAHSLKVHSSALGGYAGAQLYEQHLAGCSGSPVAAMPAVTPRADPQEQQQQQHGSIDHNNRQASHNLAEYRDSAAAAVALGAAVERRPYSSSGLVLYAAAAAAPGDCRGSLAMQQQQPLTAAERHRALVADADAALARLAACRKAAMAGGGGLQAATASDVVCGSRQLGSTDAAAAADRLSARSGTAGAWYTCSTSGVGVMDSSCAQFGYTSGAAAAGRVSRSRTQGAILGGMDVAKATAEIRGKCNMHFDEGRTASGAQPNGFRLQELQEELNALDQDFAHAEAQLQAATARIIGNPAVN